MDDREGPGSTRQLSGRAPRKTAAVTNNEGRLLKSKAEMQARWKEHFEGVLNREAPPNPPTDEEVGEGELDIDTEPPTEKEIKRVVQTLKNGKAPGIDQITAELMKVDTESTWKQGLIRKIPKKGNLQQCGNWRGVTVVPIADYKMVWTQAEERAGKI